MQKLDIGDAEFGVLGKMLRKVEFFSPLTVGQIDQILPYVLLYSYGAGEIVFAQGELGDAFYIVYTGSVTVKFKKGFFSFAKSVAALRPGDFFGEIALLSRAKRNATVVCAEPTQLFALVADDFQLVLKDNPKAALEMKHIAASRSFDTQHQK